MISSPSILIPSLHWPYEVCSDEHLYTIANLHIKSINERDFKLISLYEEWTRFDLICCLLSWIETLKNTLVANGSSAASGTTFLLMQQQKAPVSIIVVVLNVTPSEVSNSTFTLYSKLVTFLTFGFSESDALLIEWASTSTNDQIRRLVKFKGFYRCEYYG